MEELKRLENDLKNNKDLQEKLDNTCKRLKEEGAFGSDGEIMVAAAKELGYEVTIAGLEQARAAAEELDLDALEAVSGGEYMPTDEKGHDGWCVAAWHCFGVTLHTDAKSPDVSCWSDFLCIWINKDYEDWAERRKSM